MTFEEQKDQILDFLHETLGAYSSLRFEVETNDDTDPECVAFGVDIKNHYNDDSRYIILQSNDDGIEQLVGEDFVGINEIDLFANLFISDFCEIEEPTSPSPNPNVQYWRDYFEENENRRLRAYEQLGRMFNKLFHESKHKI